MVALVHGLVNVHLVQKWLFLQKKTSPFYSVCLSEGERVDEREGES